MSAHTTSTMQGTLLGSDKLYELRTQSSTAIRVAMIGTVATIVASLCSLVGNAAVSERQSNGGVEGITIARSHAQEEEDESLVCDASYQRAFNVMDPKTVYATNVLSSKEPAAILFSKEERRLCPVNEIVEQLIERHRTSNP